MNLLSLIYILLYFFSLILGPHFIRRLIEGHQLLIVPNFTIFFKRVFYLSYITYLYNAFYFSYPTIELFLNTIFINLVAIIGYIIKWYHLIKTNPFYLSGIITHTFTFMPVLFSVFFIKLNGLLNFGLISKFTITFLLIYIIFINTIYAS